MCKRAFFHIFGHFRAAETAFFRGNPCCGACPEEISDMMKILMVCLGNICRSPLAEAVLRQKATENGLDWQVDSAGTERYHTGEAPHPLAQKVAAMHGMDISGYRARRLTPDDFRVYDKIYALAPDVLEEMTYIAKGKMDPGKVDLLMNEVYPGENREVPDPWYGPESGFREAYRLIGQACDRIVARYGRGAS